MKLLNKKVIITGANRSIGQAIAIAFAKEGAQVCISYRSDEKGALQTIEAVKKMGGIGKAIYADFAHTEDVRAFFDQALDFLGHIDILVNNAAAYNTKGFLEVSVDEFEHLFKIDVTATMLLTQLTAKQMIANSIAGNVINISSISGERPYPNRIANSTAKAALNMVTKSCALELAKYNIRVNGIAPGDTPYDQNAASTASHVPLKRAGKPMDHASAALFLASEDSSWMTGQTLIIDGGQSLALFS